MKRYITLALISYAATTMTAQSLMLHYNKPAKFFEETLVIGNGNFGGAVYGGTDTDRISLNDITLWTGEPDRSSIDATQEQSAKKHEALAKVRSLLDNEDYRAADKAQTTLQGHFTETYQPLGSLTIKYLDANNEVSNYQRTLDISRAHARVIYNKGVGENAPKFETEYFCSAPDSVMVIHLKSDKAFNALISLDSQLPHKNTIEGNEIISDGYAAYHSLPNYYNARDKFFYDENRGMRYRTIVKILADNRFTATEDGIQLGNNTDVTILVANATSFNGYDKNPVTQPRDYKQLVRNRIDQAAKKPVFKLLADHVKDFQQYFNRVSLNLGKTDEAISALPTDQQLYDYTAKNQSNPELEALYFQYGRYLLISCSRTREVPANLQGLWNEHLIPSWSCNYTSNINVEENYWPAETANLGEMHLSLLSFLKNLKGSGEATAKNFYGVNSGWCLCHNTDIWAMTNPVGLNTGSPVWANWNMGGAWVSTHIWEHYTFSQDKDFLREYYPILKGAAEFCLNWLIEKNGKLMTSPSTSPENFYRTTEGYQGATLYGGTADHAMIRECLTDTRKAAQVLGIDKEFVKKIDETIAKLQPYKIGSKGNLQEWYFDWSDPEPTHRHQSHLFGLYPGHQFDAELPYQDYTTQQLKDACAKTLQIKGDNSTGWSTGWRINLYARLKDGKGAYHIYRKLLKYISPDNYKGEDYVGGGGTYPNLLDSHSPFQIDGNFGGCAGVVEMLMQSTESTITLLPAISSDWNEGSVSGICARGGFEISMTWKDGCVSEFTISSKKGGQTTVIYNGTQKTIKLKANGQKTIKG